MVKFIRFIYENYCDDKESEKNCISIFNCIIIFFLFMNLFFGFILISRINKIKNNEINNIFLYKINEILIIKILKIMTLFSCYIILLIFEFIIFYVCIKKEKIEYITRYETRYVNSRYETNNSNENRFHQRTNIHLDTTITPSLIKVAPFPDFLKDIINNLYEKIEEFLKTFIEEENKVKEKKEKFLKERESKLENFLKNMGGDSNNKKNLNNKNNKDLTTFIKDLNKEEHDIEIDILINQVNKIHYIYNLILEIIPKIKDAIIDNLKGKISSNLNPAASIIEEKLKKISDLSPKNLIESDYGKPLKTALEKYGISKTFLDSFKNDLLEERKERRKNEIKKFFKNEFEEEENNLDIDLFKFIEEEHSDEFFKNEIKNIIKKELSGQS